MKQNNHGSFVTLEDNQWLKIVRFLRSCPNAYVGQERECRRFIEGVLWIARTGAQWRLLPERYGNWNTVYKRFVRWCDNGVWKRMQRHFASDPDVEEILMQAKSLTIHYE